ncbi:MAG: hydroxylamine reductase [Bacillota bacterium]|nr:hydroxylamine reductase [Bacillota bacterium]
MFCFQCQEAAKGTGCTKAGVCGKPAVTANLQDTLIYTVKGVSYLANILRNNLETTKSADDYIVHSLFMTITNANFDDAQFFDYVRKGLEIRNSLKETLDSKNIEFDKNLDILTWTGNTEEELTNKGDQSEVGVLATANEDIRSLRELITYGLKGLAAYVHHAYVLDYENDEIYAFMHKTLSELLDDSLTVDQLVALTLETGKFSVDAMQLLDTSNTDSYGHPELTKVDLGVRKNPGILISGHDLHDMEELLIQTEGTGVDVYTHGEMLPGQYYPAFKKYDHLAGNYGNAWWQQKAEFETFNGPILFTTNCIVPPKGEVVKRIFTTGTTGFPGCTHILPDENGRKDFSEIIKLAKTLDSPTEIETGEIIGGFAHEQVFALADKVVEAVKSGAIRKFFVMAGCDGRMKSRSYYTEFAEKLPKDTIILTAGCAKYRYLKLDLGDINGIPRVLDAGQCNDSYSLALIALKLKEVFELEDINELPIAYNIAWYEQKAVTVLLALLFLGVKDIHIGPTLPAFLSPNVINVLAKNFGIATIGNVEDDLKLFLR